MTHMKRTGLVKTNKGKVFLIGTGPGDPDLITVKGLKILQQADIIIYDYLIDNIILKYANTAAELICAGGLGKTRYGNGFAKRQDVINKILVKKAKEGKNVVRLKNGDPFIFGRASEEIEALTDNKIEFAVIPGVSAANAASCFSGIPLTVRGISSNVVFSTGHEDPKKNKSFVNWENIAQSDTIVLYMAMENLPQITQKLICSGKRASTPAAVISNVSRINQKSVVGNLKDIKNKVKTEKITAPAIVIIGDVVKKEKKFNWFRQNKKLLFTGISPEKFFESGLIFHIPMIEIKPLDDYTELDNWIKKISNDRQPIIDWLIFSSRYGVFYFFTELFKMGFDCRNLNSKKVAAIGSSTANKLREYGITADLMPKKESSSGLIEEFKKVEIQGKKIFLPRSDIADKGLTENLKKLGATVYSCVAYRNVMPKNLPELDLSGAGGFDEVIFTSPSTVRNFIKRYGKPPKKIKIKTIGPVTRKEAQKWNLIA